MNLDAVLSAVADPTRRTILDRLAQQGPARITDVAAPLAMSFAAVSKHVKVLEAAGLVRREKQGREYLLSVEAQPLRAVAIWAQTYERFWSERLDHLEDFFVAKANEKRKRRS